MEGEEVYLLVVGGVNADDRGVELPDENDDGGGTNFDEVLLNEEFDDCSSCHLKKLHLSECPIGFEHDQNDLPAFFEFLQTLSCAKDPQSQ